MKNTLIIVVMLISYTVKADFHSALNAYNQENYENAFKQFMIMAADGEKRSQFNLGVMYFNGQHVKQDINKAYAWLKLAVDSDIAKEPEMAAYQSVASQIQDKSKAEKEYKLLEKQYSTEILLEKLYPEFVKPENENAFYATPLKIVQPDYPRKAAISGAQGWTRFQFDIDKNGVPRNIQLLESFPENVFVRNSIKAIQKWTFNVATNYSGQAIEQKNLIYTMQFQLSGSNGIKLKENVIEEHKENAYAGDANAQFKIGLLQKKLNISVNETNPNEWFLKAAIQGHPRAQYEIGRSLITLGC